MQERNLSIDEPIERDECNIIRKRGAKWGLLEEIIR